MRTVGSGPHRRLSRTGKPMRALRALRHTDQDHQMSEVDVWSAVRVHADDKSTWHGPLYVLVDHGLVVRVGRRGGYQWYITDAGRRLLKQVNES